MTIEVKGLRETANLMKDLPVRLQKKVVRQAVRAATVVAQKAIQGSTYTTVTRRTGLLKAGMRVRGLKKPRPADQIAAGVYALPATGGFLKKNAGKLRNFATKKGERRTVKAPFYWRFIEFGTKRQAPRSYIGRAFAGVASQMTEVLRQRMAAGIEKEVKAASRR